MDSLRGRNLLSSLDLSPDESRALCERALAFKRGGALPRLPSAFLSLIFFNPSVRTRLSCEAAAGRLGARSTAVTAGSDTWNFEERDGIVMDGETQEHVRELAPVVSRYSTWIGVRKSERIATGLSQGAASAWDVQKREPFLTAFSAHAEVPVVNLESNTQHPLQGLADQATLLERLGGEARGSRYVLTWAWHPKALPVATPHSQLVAACDLGMDVVLARPTGFGLDPELVAAARARAQAGGGSLSETDDVEAACEGARVVCAKAWGSLDYLEHPPEDERAAKEPLRERWIVDEAKMARTADAFFLHCLPVRRNVVVTDGVLDSAASAVIDEAENRMWTAAAVLAALAGA